MRKTILIFLVLITLRGFSQQGYAVHDKVNDFPFTTAINNPSAYNSLYAIKNDIILLDFFGTWCTPCIKALPRLRELQEKYNDKIRVILVSNENKERLEKFIAIRQPFSFPVVVDEENSVTGQFTPPSYPYTVVISKERKIIAITDAAAITDDMVNNWINGKTDPAIVPDQPVKQNFLSTVQLTSYNKLVQLSQEFMYAAKTGDNTDQFTGAFSGLNYTDLKNMLRSDDEKKAFWINLYNGFTQVLLKQDPGLYKKRGRFFSSRQIHVAGKGFSLDDIEHGILRRSKIKWSLGHLNKIFPGRTEKELRVKEIDYRIHFALNCGARSCPPIAFYNPENLNPQLELATNAYLQSEAVYDEASNTLQLPAIMGWFRGDFGGKRKMVALLKEKKIIPVNSSPKIRFKPYDWTLYTNNYKN